MVRPKRPDVSLHCAQTQRRCCVTLAHRACLFDVHASLEIVQLEVGLLQNFCEVIGCPVTGAAALVDPAFEVDRLLAVVERKGWHVTTILLTHGHDDHVAGLDEAVAATQAVVRCHPLEVAHARAVARGGDGLRIEPVAHHERIAVGAGEVVALWTPGHVAACVCWYLPRPGAVITGDVLFVGSCGGVHYGDSDPAAMFHSLQHELAALPESTRVYPGHDYGATPTSTMAWELAHNPALRCSTLAEFCAHKRVPVPPEPARAGVNAPDRSED